MPWNSPYRGTKEAQIALFDDFASRYSNIVKKEIIGYSLENRPIPMYRVGNPLGGKYLFDGCIHGCSDLSTEVHYQYLKWILESGDPTALNIQQKKCLLIIPMFNVDRATRKNARNGYWPNGVDLNRNFTYNWTSGGTTDPINDYYRGTSAASEPETQVLRNVFQTEKPEIYCNFHNWGGPYLNCRSYNSAQSTKGTQIFAAYNTLAQQMGVERYTSSITGLSGGQASSDAAVLGATSFLIELVDMANNVPPNYNSLPTLAQIESYYWPKVKPFQIAMAQAVSDAPSQGKYAFSHWQDGDQNNPKTVNL